MKKLIFGISTPVTKYCLTILIALILTGCQEGDKITNKQKFVFFELAYTSGWAKGIAFSVDSAGIFFAPITSELLQYGTLPDSIVEDIKNTLTSIIRDTAIKSHD